MLNASRERNREKIKQARRKEGRKEGMESRKMKSDFRERMMRRMLRDDEMGDIKKGPWKVEEDEVLINHVNKYGPRDWSSIRSKGLLRRTGKSCRLRWVNKLRPNLKTGVKFSPEEERTVIDLQAQFGNKWAKIATFLPGRTDNDVKNFWSSRQKRLARILQTSTPPPPPPPSSSSTKSSKATEEIQTPAFHIIPSLKEPHLCAYPGAVVEDHRAPPVDYMYMIPEKKIFPEEEPRISFQPDYPLLMEGQDFIGRLGVPSFLEDEFEHSSRSALGTAEVPILPSFPAQGSSQVTSHETEDIGSLIDDFPPIDLFDQIEQLPSPSEWQLP